jgi:hypothetical protein
VRERLDVADSIIGKHRICESRTENDGNAKHQGWIEAGSVTWKSLSQSSFTPTAARLLPGYCILLADPAVASLETLDSSDQMVFPADMAGSGGHSERHGLRPDELWNIRELRPVHSRPCLGTV